MDRKRLAPTQPTVDIGMRLVMPLGLYRDVGMIMDEIQASVRNSVGAMPEARFEFISFMTNPCLNMEMNRARYPEDEVVDPGVIDESQFERGYAAGRQSMMQTTPEPSDAF